MFKIYFLIFKNLQYFKFFFDKKKGVAPFKDGKYIEMEHLGIYIFER